MSTMGKIAKDGFQALLVVLGIGVVLVFFFGYGGFMITALIGMIFLVAFVVKHIAELGAFFIYKAKKEEFAPPPPLPDFSAPQPAVPKFCPQCGAPWAAGAEACVKCG